MDQEKRQTVPDILLKFAELLGTTVHNNRLVIPAGSGSGYCMGFVFNAHIRILISHYELRKDIIVPNTETRTEGKIIFFKFLHSFPEAVQQFPGGNQALQTPSVLIATSRINTDDFITINSNTATINIEVDAAYLDKLLEQEERSPVLQSLLQATQPLLFEQIVYPSLQKLVDEILNGSTQEIFRLFFLRIKAEELICRLLMELEKRDEKQLYPLNSRDIQAIYKVRDQMLENLDTPPVIAGLAINAGMSATKLKRLFRQIFGNSIFSYYQAARIKEAARLLKEEKLSVSDAGYRSGFTNLSHFSRVFKEHIGMNPKEYSRH